MIDTTWADVPSAELFVRQREDVSKGAVVGRIRREVKLLMSLLSPSVGLTWSGIVETRTYLNFLNELVDLLWTLSYPFYLRAACLTTEVVWPVKTTVLIKLEGTPVMQSFCVHLRRAVLRRYRQVPRTEADGAFDYSQGSNRRGLLNSGMLDALFEPIF